MRISDWSSDVCSSDLRGQRNFYFRRVLCDQGGDALFMGGIELAENARNRDLADACGAGFVDGIDDRRFVQRSDFPSVIFIASAYHFRAAAKDRLQEIGRASCRERGGQ